MACKPRLKIEIRLNFDPSSSTAMCLKHRSEKAEKAKGENSYDLKRRENKKELFKDEKILYNFQTV